MYSLVHLICCCCCTVTHLPVSMWAGLQDRDTSDHRPSQPFHAIVQGEMVTNTSYRLPCIHSYLNLLLFVQHPEVRLRRSQDREIYFNYDVKSNGFKTYSSSWKTS
ncbi:hypothetical protein EDB19DRAFT_1692067 [Suillus lakei]|nr:hypothetical protein EDB19DRAFT_1692067 [Suillus lakei]